MRKLIIAAAAAAAALSGASSFAQGSAECQAGSAWGTPAGCESNANVQGPIYGNSGWPPGGTTVYGYPYVAQALPQYVAPYAYNVPRTRYLHPSRRDRDGDGVRNSQDRYPDDARYY